MEMSSREGKEVRNITPAHTDPSTAGRWLGQDNVEEVPLHREVKVSGVPGITGPDVSLTPREV